MLPTDAAQAATLLTNAGWVLNSNGIREKNGEELALDIVYYTFRPDLVTMAPLIKASYEALGIKATTRVNDDGNFILGETPELANVFIGAGFNAFGIASGGGAGMALAWR